MTSSASHLASIHGAHKQRLNIIRLSLPPTIVQPTNEPRQWLNFTNEIVEGAKLTASEDAAAWSAGTSVGAVSSTFLLVFGPPIGYYVGKAVHKKTVVNKVKERML